MLEQPVEHGHVRQNITSRAEDPVTLLQQLSFYLHLQEGNKKIKKKKKKIRYLKEISSCMEWIFKGIKKWYVVSKDFFYLNLKPLRKKDQATTVRITE